MASARARVGAAALLLAAGTAPIIGSRPAAAAGGTGVVEVVLNGAGYFSGFACDASCTGALYGSATLTGLWRGPGGETVVFATPPLSGAGFTSQFQYSDVAGPSCPALGFARGTGRLTWWAPTPGAVVVGGAVGSVDGVEVDVAWTAVRVGTAFNLVVTDATLRVAWHTAAQQGTVTGRAAVPGNTGVLSIPMEPEPARDFAGQCRQSGALNFWYDAAPGAIAFA